MNELDDIFHDNAALEIIGVLCVLGFQGLIYGDQIRNISDVKL